MIMHGNIDAGREQLAGQKRLGKILQGIRLFKAERGHGAGKNDGRRRFLQVIIQILGGLLHGICAVQNDDRTLVLQQILHGEQDHLPIPIGHLQRIFAQQVIGLDLAVRQPQPAEHFVQYGAAVGERTALLIIDLFDGPARGDDVDFFFHNKTYQ